MKRTALTFLCLSTFALSALAADDSTATPTPADNTGHNARDRSGDSKTPMDQSNSSADIKITAAIRSDVMKDDSLSMTAKNVKIITADGMITLRGPVKTIAEKTTIAKIAHRHSGDARVMNQLEVEPAK